MRPFLRAIRIALRYKYSILLSVLCSAAVAVLWGANISAIYPFVEVVFRGQSLHEWADRQIAEHQQNIALCDEQITALQEATDEAASDSRRAEVESALAQHRASRRVAEKSLGTCRKLEPWIRRFAPKDAFHTLILFVTLLLVGTALKGMFLMASSLLVARVGHLTSLELQNRFFRTLLYNRLGATVFNSTGESAAQMGGDIGAIGQGITVVFGKTLREPLKMISCLVAAAHVNWRLLVFSVVICLPASFLLFRLAKSIKRANLRAFEEMAGLIGQLIQTTQCFEIVKAFTRESYERNRFRQRAHEVYRRTMKIAFYNATVRINNELLGIVVICISMLAGGYLVLKQQTHVFGIRLTSDTMDFSSMMLFYALLIGCTDPIRKLADVYAMIQAGVAASERVLPLLDRPRIVKDPVNPVPLKQARLDLVVDNVHFRYSPELPVLRGVSLHVPYGQSLAIIGQNGCGKSSLINLILRFFDPDEGSLRLGETDLRQFRQKQLRRRIGLVTQHTILFGDSVVNNIRYGAPKATLEQVIEAARQAHAHEFIVSQLAEGYDTNCGEMGQNLSGGQRQRISLARAILKSPDIFIFDEATSQIDPESEQLIQQSLREVMRDRTAIIITHRLSTLDLADRIAVMDAGVFVDVGSHEELMSRCELYRGLRNIELMRAA